MRLRISAEHDFTVDQIGTNQFFSGFMKTCALFLKYLVEFELERAMLAITFFQSILYLAKNILAEVLFKMEESSSTRKRKLDSPNTKHKVFLRSHCKVGQTKLSECISCPVCTLSIRGEKELKHHYDKEVKKVDSLGKNLMRKKCSMRLRSSQDDDEEIEEIKFCEREDILQNIKKNKYDRYSQMFLFSINRTKVWKNSSYNNDTNSSRQIQRSGYDLAQCAICNEFLEVSNEESSRHLSKCFAKKDNEFDLYSESENEDDDIVEEFSWAGQTRIRTSSLVNREIFQSEGRLTRVEMEDTDEILDVDGDDEYYGDEQYLFHSFFFSLIYLFIYFYYFFG